MNMSVRSPSPPDQNTEKHEVQVIIRTGDSQRLVEFASTKGHELARGQQEASKAQIRRIFGEIKQIEMRWSREPRASADRLRMLKPRLAYAAARPNIGPGVGRLRDILTPAVDAVLEAEDEKARAERFRTFVRFTEALLAYFTAARGGDQGDTGTAPRRQGDRDRRA
jgi:CRISPR type III-A-associated protein Csm2